jgi:hypothetical protein
VLESQRVVEIWVDALPEPQHGTGYLLCTGCVVTAYHTIKNAQAAPEIRQLGTQDWYDVSVLWKDETLDLALLELPSFEALDLPILVPSKNFQQEVKCYACGFPSFEEVETPEKIICQEYTAEGWIKRKNLTVTKEAGVLQMEIKGGVPGEITDWEGISGAMVFSDHGNAIGVLTKCPTKLQGQQLRLISLGWVVEQYPDFQQVVRDRFQQTFEFEKSIADRAEELYKIDIQIRMLELNKVCSQTESAEREKQLRELERQRQDCTESLTSSQRSLGNSKEKRLATLLNALNHYDVALFDNTWFQIAPTRYQSRRNVQDIHAVLCTSIDKGLVDRFLKRAIERLRHQNPTNEILIQQLNDLRSEFPPPNETTATPNDPSLAFAPTDSKTSSIPLLLFGLTSEAASQGAIDYTLSIYHISDSTTYQQRVRDEDSLEEISQPLALPVEDLDEYDLQPIHQNSFGFRVESADEIETIKDILTATVQLIFDTYPKLEKSKPHLYFYLPKSLLTIDCHNLDCDDGNNSLGLEYPVVTTCFDRHKQPKRSKKLWCNRWDGLHCEPRLPLHRHIRACDEQPNGKPFDFEKPKALNKQLKQIDGQGATLVGLQFAGNDFNFHTICDTLFATGLSLFLYPSSPLTAIEMDNLSQALGQTCIDRFLTTLKDKYRINSESEEDAGSLIVLLDNPYLPLPEIEYH